jgi:DNA (cytosine-5)-methyltransferase 1
MDDLLTINETCDILKVHANTLRNWDKSGYLSATRIGVRGDRRYKKSDVMNLTVNSPAGNRTEPTVLDLFSGCGGLSYGFEQAGYRVLAGIDHWDDALKTFKHNHRSAETYNLDLFNFDINEFEKQAKYSGSVDVIVGGPPCQGFSIAGHRLKDDPRNSLYKAFVDFVEFYEPKVFLLENVPNLISMDQGSIKDGIIKDFEELGYTVRFKKLLASDYGVPQARRRVVFVGSKDGKEFTFPEPTHKTPVTSKEALSDLLEDTVAEGAPYETDPLNEYQSTMRKASKGIYNHVATVHTDQTRNIISLVPDGGNFKSLPEELQNTRKVNIAWTRINSEKPSMTIDTGHNHHFHYEFNRVPTARESARLQSFPDDFIFLGGKTSQLKQIGNAVPPLMAMRIAESIKDQYEL